MSLSFKIIRPTQNQNQNYHSSNSTRQTNHNNTHNLDSSDEEYDNRSGHSNKRPLEFISDFDFTRQPTRSNDGKNSNQISIPALPDRDFRAVHLARKQKRAKKELYKPDQVNSMGGISNGTPKDLADLEGLDKMNSKTIEGGLKAPSTVKVKRLQDLLPSVGNDDVSNHLKDDENLISVTSDQVPQSIEERAVKELLSQATDSQSKQIKIDAIHMIPETEADLNAEDSSDSGDETAQFRRDVSKRPDCSTLEDYERIPVGQFGLALLKGMGWKEGTAATKRGRVGLVEAYVPQARPSLLGIGAKPLAPAETDSTNKKTKAVKPEKKYVPLLRKVIDNGGKTRQRSRSRSPNRDHASPAPSSHSRTSLDSSSRSGRPDEDRARHRDSRDPRKPDPSRQRDSYRDREERDRRNYSDDERPSRSHRSSSDSHHRHSSSSSNRHHHHHSSRDRSTYN